MSNVDYQTDWVAKRLSVDDRTENSSKQKLSSFSEVDLSAPHKQQTPILRWQKYHFRGHGWSEPLEVFDWLQQLGNCVVVGHISFLNVWHGIEWIWKGRWRFSPRLRLKTRKFNRLEHRFKNNTKPYRFHCLELSERNSRSWVVSWHQFTFPDKSAHHTATAIDWFESSD